MTAELRVIPVTGLPEIEEGDDLAALLVRAVALADGDVVVVAQKVVSKAEGRIVSLDDVEPSERAREIAGPDRDPRHVELILREAVRLVRVRPPLVIAETRHGFVCASAGVDASNAPAAGTLVLLPLDPDASATALGERLTELLGVAPAVLISDSFGRPWRLGIVDVCLGIAGAGPLDDQRGRLDADGRTMRSTVVAVADEICSTAELAMGKVSRRPVVLVRGVSLPPAGRGVREEVVMPRSMDLFS